ncbi:MAG: methyltransferase domain-containing protein [Candidatus Binatia bacterium]
MSREDREIWEAKHRRPEGEEAASPPAPFVAENAFRLRPGCTLDLAAGSGRNAVFLAELRHRVIAADVAAAALRRIRRRAADAGVAAAVDLAQVDLDRPSFRRASVDNVICVDFLDRRLFAEIHAWLRPGGALLYDTFLIDQRLVGHPRNPEFLLDHGELRERLRGFRILVYREGPVVDGGRTSYRSGAVAIRAC